MAQILGAVLCLLVVVSVGVAQTTRYCSLCADHTMCKYTGPGPKCSPRISGGVDEKDKTAILNAHNTLRNKVAQGLESRGTPGPQPPAADMRKIVWSTELAHIAQRWADQCDFKNDACRRVTDFGVGQNLYKSSSYGSAIVSEWGETVNYWYDNVQKFNKNSISPYQFSNAGGYSQVAWAETYQVGCGYTVFKEKGDNQFTHQIYVCNYGPRGNIIGKTMYKKGEACSKCPAGTSCSVGPYPALCQ